MEEERSSPKKQTWTSLNIQSWGPNSWSIFIYWNTLEIISSTCSTKNDKWQCFEWEKNTFLCACSFIISVPSPFSVMSISQIKNIKPLAPSMFPAARVFTQPAWRKIMSNSRRESNIKCQWLSPCSFKNDNKLPFDSCPSKCEIHSPGYNIQMKS